MNDTAAAQPGSALPVTAQDVHLAWNRIRAQVSRTPLLYSRPLSQLTGGAVYLKCENLQHTGSFKFRGGSNAVLSLTDAQKAAGVLAYSSGNHAQGVACAAQLAGVEATIVMPLDAPRVKVENTRRLGAKVVQYDRYTQSREEIGTRLAAESGAELIKPYDDTRVIAGQGTCGLEILDQCKQRGLTPDQILVCCGGGGLTSGIALVVKEALPQTQISPCEPWQFDDVIRSLHSGERQGNDPDARSICDAIVTPSPGELTFPILSTHCSGGYAVTDEEAKRAVTYLFRQHRLVVEPGGAVTAAAVLANPMTFRDQTLVLTLSGGNIDEDQLSEYLAAS